MHLKESRTQMGYHGYQVVVFWLLYLTTSKTVVGSGYFKLQLLQLREFGATKLKVACPLAFHLCLKEHQDNPLGVGACSYGNASLIPGDSGYIWNKENLSQNISLTVTFEYSWPASFTLVLDLTCANESGELSPLVERVLLSQHLLPTQKALRVSFTGERYQGAFTIGVSCSPHYYSHSCSKFCRPRHDKFGHYQCNSEGEKVCMEGWVGDNCQTAVCREGCDSNHGSCVRPGECRCSFGWQGEFCMQCIPYPGCVHGGCQGSPWQCVCELNWGGILCDKDLNPCGREVYPCQNGGLCENVEPNQYRCVCSPGYTGKNCQHSIESCVTRGCGNHGNCHTTDILSVCTCDQGWNGVFCEQKINECSSMPCDHGVCEDLIGGYQCTCDSGWSGRSCSQDVEECLKGPCIHALACHNYMGGYVCECVNGWGGQNCDINLNECESDSCLNGGTCVDMVAGFYCSCPTGFHGAHCQLVKDPCDSNPCHHGGRCHGDGGVVRCLCPDTYSGVWCEVSLAPCSSNPCQHGGTCVTLTSGYHCVCLPYYTGDHCGVTSSPVPLRIGICDYKNMIYREGDMWWEDCNTCSCEGSTVICTQVICGPKNCVSHPNETYPSLHCPWSQSCLADNTMPCITPPCLPWGVCQSDSEVQTLPDTTDCLAETCTQLTLVMDTNRLPQGLWLESICREIRNQSVIRETSLTCQVSLTCSVLSRGEQLHLKAKLALGVVTSLGISEVAKRLVYSIKRVDNTSLLGAIVMVTVKQTETHTLQYSNQDTTLLLAVVCAALLVLTLLSLTLLILCYRRRIYLAKSSSQHQALLTSSSTSTVATVTKTHNTALSSQQTVSRTSTSRHSNPMYRQDTKEVVSENTDLMCSEEESCEQENVFNQFRDMRTSVKLGGVQKEDIVRKKGATRKTSHKENVYRGEYSLDISRTDRYILEA